MNYGPATGYDFLMYKGRTHTQDRSAAAWPFAARVDAGVRVAGSPAPPAEVGAIGGVSVVILLPSKPVTHFLLTRVQIHALGEFLDARFSGHNAAVNQRHNLFRSEISLTTIGRPFSPSSSTVRLARIHLPPGVLDVWI